jgi:gliding motility-associated-like protein
MKRIITLLLLLPLTNQIFAQLIDAEPEVTTMCNGGIATLTATLTPPGSGSAPGSLPTNSYALSTIPYAPDPLTAGTPVTLTDDSQTGLIPIGFDFCYFGATYSQFIIGSNNWIGFQSGETSTWVTAPIPNTNGGTTPRNTIMGPWQDINPGVGGTVKYAVYGIAPFRRLAVSWNNVPMFSCTGQLYSSQIIIYETSNIIETHILNKSLCTTWNSGNAVHGLHNSTGTVAFTVPGRNNTQWVANNEGKRWTPNGTAKYYIKWYILPANTLIATDSFTIPPATAPYTSTINVSPVVSPQFYYAEVTGPNGCGSGGPNTDTVVVNSSTIFVDAGPYTNICQGGSTMLNAFGGTNYSWSPATGLSNPTIPNPIASPSVATTYTVMVTDPLGCFAFDTVTVGVNSVPLVDAGFYSGVCAGDSITLGGNASGGTVLWSPGSSLSDSTILTPNAAPSVPTTYTLTVTNSEGCSASDTVSINILNISMDAGPDQIICPGTSTPLNATGGTTYSWSPATGLSNPNIANPIASPAVATTYTVSITDNNTGCSGIDSVTISLHPPAVANAGSDTSICIGNNTTLGASGGINFAWTPTTGLSDSTIFNPVASPTTTTTYTVIVSDASGCVSSDSVKVIVNMLPVVNAGNDASVCVGASASLLVTGANSYIWSPGTTLNDSTIANPISSPSVATTYVVTGTDVNGCVSTDTVTVSLNPLAITTGPGGTICSGDSINLSVSGAFSYVWSSGFTLNDSTIANPLAGPTDTLTYTVIGTATTGCRDTATVTINVNPLPLVSAGSPLSICQGSSANLSATGANTYVWSPASSLNNPNIPNPIATPSVTTGYTVIGTDLNGCSSSNSTTVTVNPLPAANAGTNTTICLGSSTNLNATGGGTYLWTPSAGLSATNIANPVATPTVTTTYTVTVTGAGSCTSTSQVTITVNPMPVANAGPDASICNGVSTTLNATGGTNYFWTPSTGLSNSTIANPVATPSVTTTYTVTASNSFGCSSTDVVIVNVSNAITMGSPVITQETCTNGNGTIVAQGVTGGSHPYSYSLNGGAAQTPPSFTQLSAGTYTLTVIDNNGCIASQTVTLGQEINVNASFTADPTEGPKPLTVNFTNTSTPSGPSLNYFWDFGNGSTSTETNPSTVYTTQGTYTVTLTTTNGNLLSPCVDVATVTIIVNEEAMFVIPNVFTPNGDGHNDNFVMQSIGVDHVDGEIFNRWGRRVYEWSGDAKSGWDGKVNGKTAQDGTYYYVIKVKPMTGETTEEKGYFQLLGN